VTGPKTTWHGVVAIDPHTAWSGVTWDRSLAGTNDDVPRFGIAPPCSGVRESTERDQKTKCQDRPHCVFSNQSGSLLI
jgi:hypothetical protein